MHLLYPRRVAAALPARIFFPERTNGLTAFAANPFVFASVRGVRPTSAQSLPSAIYYY
jgi:hypothetical protein